MAILELVKAPDPRLKLVSQPVPEVDSDLKTFMADMLETMYDANGIGLAAIQVGVAKRVAVIDLDPGGPNSKPLYIVNPRIVTNYMETRAAVCEYDAKRDHLTITVGSQGSHRLRDILCQTVLKISTDKMRVICPDVGGGFGTKLFPYREYALLAVAAKKLRRAVKWAADRADHPFGLGEHILGAGHGEGRHRRSAGHCFQRRKPKTLVK